MGEHWALTMGINYNKLLEKQNLAKFRTGEGHEADEEGRECGKELSGNSCGEEDDSQR